MVGELDASRAELEAARREGDADAAADVEAVWRNRFRRALRSDPEAAQGLRDLLADLASETGRPTVEVVNSVSGGVQHGPVIQGHTFSNLTFHTGPQTPHPDGGEARKE